MFKLSKIMIIGGLFLSSFSVPTWASTNIQDAPAPYLTTSRSLPHNARGLSSKFRFGLNISGYSVSQISIGLPRQLMVGGVSVRDADGQVIETSAIINNQTVVIEFSQPVLPGTPLRIELSSVRMRSMLGRVWLMPISVRRADSVRDSPIGTARIHTY